MTTDLMLDETGDIAFDGMDISVGDGAAVVAQRVEMRLSTVKGHWFLDTSLGTPYYANILGKNFNPTTLNAIFLDVILGTPGVAKLNEPIAYTFDRRARKLSMSFIATTTAGASLPIDFSIS